MKSYLSLVKFAHTVFALPFAALSFFLAIRWNDMQVGWKLPFFILLCMVFARSAAMAFNRYVDRRIDAQNERTNKREIPAGVIPARSALWFVIFNSLAFVAVTYFINPLVFWLSPLALLVILGYSYTKRFTWLCHLILGIGLGLAPLGAFLAVTGEFHLLPVLYAVLVMLWVSGFDIIYALQDEAFDKRHGLHSVPERFGKHRAKKISMTLHFCCACLLIYIGWYQNQLLPSLGLLHWVGAIGFIVLLFRQHRLVKLHDLSRINQAFFETNGIASILFGSAVILDILI